MTQAASITELTDAFIGWFFDHNPITAASLGAFDRDSGLGDFSANGIETRLTEAREWISRFESRSPMDGADDIEDAVDRDLAVSALRGELISAEWGDWRRDPAYYTAPIFNSLFETFLHRLAPEPELVAATIGKLADVPAVLAACRANLDPALASRTLVLRGLEQARTARDFLTVALPGEVADPAARERIATAAEPATRAFDELVVFLGDLAENAKGDWRLGEAAYSAILRERELLGYGAGELHANGRRHYAELDSRLAELSAGITGGNRDWQAAMAELQNNHPPTMEAMLAEYSAESERARRFVAERELITFPDAEECRVLPAPAFNRPIFPVAFYIPPPSLTASRIGHLFVPVAPDDFTAEQRLARLRGNSLAQIPTVTVHEGYPGHHWHLSWMAKNPRVMRKIFRTPYFAEGWGLYAETLMREQGYFREPGHELAHYDGLIFRAARVIVDTALHCGEMTTEQAVEFMSSKTSLSPSMAAAEVRRYRAWPTQAPSYLTGCLELRRLRDDYLAAGRGTLRSFHDALCGAGILPLGLARRVVMSA